MANLPPAEIIASWPTPNYVNPETRGPQLLIVSIVFTSLAFVLTSLRMYTRIWITASFGVDDMLGLVALLAAIAMGALTSLATARYGWDRHAWDVPLQWLPDSLKMRMAFQITFTVASCFTKLSLLWFCRRILGAGIKGPFRVFNYCLIGAMALVFILALIFILLTIFTCIPIQASFDLMPTYSYHCLDGNRDVFIASVVNIFTDFLTTVVPMPLIWRLKLPLRQRIAVIAIFGLGITVNIAGSVRTYYTWKDMIGSYDETWYAWPVAMAGAIEINLGLICASAPALRPLLVSFIPRLFPSARGTSYGQSHRTPKPWISTARSESSRVMISSKLRGENDHDDPRGYSLDGIVRTVEMETFVEQRPRSREDKAFGAMTGAHQNTSHNHMGGVQVHYIGDGASSSGSRTPDRFKAEDESPFAYAT